MTKIDDEDFENSTKYWTCDSDYIDGDVKVRDHCHIAGKCRRSTHRDSNINDKLNHKISAVFRNLNNYDSHPLLKELGRQNQYQ